MGSFLNIFNNGQLDFIQISINRLSFMKIVKTKINLLIENQSNIFYNWYGFQTTINKQLNFL